MLCHGLANEQSFSKRDSILREAKAKRFAKHVLSSISEGSIVHEEGVVLYFQLILLAGTAIEIRLDMQVVHAR
jgi:hypothetical protein